MRKLAAFVILPFVGMIAIGLIAQTQVNYPEQVRNGPMYSDAGPVGATLQTLCAKANAGNGTLAITKNWNALLAQTISCPIQAAGGIIQPAGTGCGVGGGSPCTVTISGPVTVAATQQLFDISTGGTVAFASPLTNISPIWWCGMQAKDYQPCIAAANTAALTGGGTGAKICMPPGAFPILETATISSFLGVEFCGYSWATNFIWGGGTTGPVLSFTGDTQPHIHDFQVTVPASNPITSGGVILFTDGGTQTSTSSLNQDIFINCNGGGTSNCYNGFQTSGTDANNDFHQFDRTRVIGASHACWEIQGSQAYSYRFDANYCLPYGTPATTYALEATGPGGSGSFGASFIWKNGGISSQNFNFNVTGSSEAPFDIDGLNAETCGGLVNIGDGIITQLHIHHIRWIRAVESYCTNTNPEFLHVVGGNILMDGGNFVEANGGVTANAKIITMYYHETGTAWPGTFTVNNTVFANNNFTLSQMLTGDVPAVVSNEFPPWNSVTWAAIQSQEEIGFLAPYSYTTGTVTANGTTTLTGSGTTWTSVMQGGAIQFGGVIYTVTAVGSATNITLDVAAPSGAGQSYIVGYGGSPQMYPAGSSSLQAPINLTVPGNMTTPVLCGVYSIYDACVQFYQDNGPKSIVSLSQSVNGVEVPFASWTWYTGVSSSAPSFGWLQPGLFADLASCGSGAAAGSYAVITDSTTQTWGASIGGSGSYTVLGFCDGSNWTVAGK